MATIKDIAEAVGVSIGTVDRILHNRGRFSEQTAEKVRRAMEELHYTPNIHARGLKKTKGHTFAAVLPRADQDGGYWRLVEEGVLRASRALVSYSSRVRLFSYDRTSSASCLSALSEALESGAEGLLTAPTRPEDFRTKLKKASLPYLFIDTDIPALGDRISFIGQNSRQSGILSGKLMSLLLAGAGSPVREPRILLVDPPGRNDHLRNRLEGFRESLEDRVPGVRFHLLKEESGEEASCHLSLKKAFEEAGRPDGIFVANSSVYFVASFLEGRGGNDPALPLIGYDLLPGKEPFMDRGTVDFVLTQQPQEQGYRGIMILYDHLVLKKEVPREIITPLNIITKENWRTFQANRPAIL